VRELDRGEKWCVVLRYHYYIIVICKMNGLKSHAHSVFSLHIHIVFVTKYRKKVITEPILTRLKAIFTKLCETQKCCLTEFNGEADHVHLLIELAPDIAISKLVNILKTISSREIRKESPIQI